MGKTPAAATCITYCRTSTKGQADAMTIKAQRTTVQRLQAQYGPELLAYGPRGDGRLEDDGRSGRLLEGREFKQLIDAIEAGVVKPDYLIVPRTSRLSREDTFAEDKAIQIQSAIDTARINSILRVNDVKVIDVKGVHDDLRQEALEDSHERDKIRDWTMGGKHEKFSEGKRATGGHASYGYRLEREDPNNRKSGLVQVKEPDNAKRLDRLIAWFIKGGYAYAAREATKAAFPLPKTGKFAPWNAVTVRHIIERVCKGVYSGKQAITFGKPGHKVTYELTYESLVDKKTQLAVIRASNELTLPRRATFLSTGFVDCKCGGHVHERNSHGKHHATCARKCGRIPEHVFGATLWLATVARIIQIKEHTGADGDGKNFDARLRAATAKVKDIEDQMLRLYTAKTDLPLSVWKGLNEPLTVALARAQHDVKEIEDERTKDESERASAQSLEGRIDKVLAELVRGGEPTLERKREVLADLLRGGRVIVEWGKAVPFRLRDNLRPPAPCPWCREPHSPDVPSCHGCGVCLTGVHCLGCHSDHHNVEDCEIFGRWASITLPAHRGLPPITARTDEQSWKLVGDAVVDDGKVRVRVKLARNRTWTQTALLTPAEMLTGDIENFKWAPMRDTDRRAAASPQRSAVE